MPGEAREKLASLQAELVAALTRQAAPPAGFNATRIAAAASALMTKRMRAVARAWPELGEAFAGFAARFQEYALSNPLPHAGGPLADGRVFVRWLSHRLELESRICLRALAVDLRYVASASGLTPRRRPALGIARLRDSHRLIVAVRFPGLGEWWGSVPWLGVLACLSPNHAGQSMVSSK
jgi:hypothetical protein